MSENKLPRFYELLSLAQDAVEAVDSFDVDSKNPESRKKWNSLLEEQRATGKALIEYIQENRELLPQIVALCRAI